MKTFLLPALVGLIGSQAVMAEIKPASLFQDHAVLQRGRAVPIWGEAAPGSKIRAIFGKQQHETIADEAGRWRITLDPLESGERGDLVLSGDGEVTLRNLAAGEVWIAAGQSNMAMPVYLADNAETEMATANFPEIRFFNVKDKTSTEPQTHCDGKWTPVDPKGVRNVSAAAYSFAREIHQKLGCPVGIIQSAWGGTPVEAWISSGTLNDEKFEETRRRYEGYLKNLPANKEQYAKALREWEEKKAEAEKNGQPFKTSKPPIPVSTETREWISGLYNAMIHPLVPYAMRGVIWYQGEANTAYHKHYADLFSAMIGGWRQAWEGDPFPFLFVQLPNWKQPGQPGELWARLRDAQAAAEARTPNTYMITSIDIGDPVELHPKNKQAIGHRLALAALGEVYKAEPSQKSPRVVHWEASGSKVVVRFDQAGLRWRDGRDDGFVLAGKDRKFHTATVEINGDTVTLTSSEVPAPVAVRYAWANSPEALLFNEKGLPATPFRSDSW